MTKPGTMILRKLPAALVLGLALAGCKPTAATHSSSTNDCKPLEVGQADSGLVLSVSDRVVKTIGPEYFGFNLENTEFQLSLWDPEKHQVRPEVVRYLKDHFPGAVYRYPGGTTSNYHRWKTSVGVVKKRVPVRINDWTELPRIEFGVDEFLDFVDSTGGQVWYVLNLKGDIDKLVSIDTMAREAGELTRHIHERKVPVLRWELGNELDRFEEKWISNLYVDRAKAVMASVRKIDPKARFVAMMADFDAQSDRGINASQYNTALARGLKGQVSEFAQHLYYDGEPDGPPVPNRTNHVCESIADARAGGIPADDIGFWITEHARWPEGQGEEWNGNWNQSGDLGASIGMADLIISSTQLPQVKGSDLHALHGTTGPWPMFHMPQGKSAYHPSVTMHAYALLRETLLPEVLATEARSANPADYGGGYSARGTVMASADRSKYSVWAINRDAKPTEVTLNLSALAGRKVKAGLASISGATPQLNNYGSEVVDGPSRQQVDLSFDAKGVARYTVGPNSISGLTFGTPR